MPHGRLHSSHPLVGEERWQCHLNKSVLSAGKSECHRARAFPSSTSPHHIATITQGSSRKGRGDGLGTAGRSFPFSSLAHPIAVSPVAKPESLLGPSPLGLSLVPQALTPRYCDRVDLHPPRCKRGGRSCPWLSGVAPPSPLPILTTAQVTSFPGGTVRTCLRVVPSSFLQPSYQKGPSPAKTPHRVSKQE